MVRDWRESIKDESCFISDFGDFLDSFRARKFITTFDDTFRENYRISYEDTKSRLMEALRDKSRGLSDSSERGKNFVKKMDQLLTHAFEECKKIFKAQYPDEKSIQYLGKELGYVIGVMFNCFETAYNQKKVEEAKILLPLKEKKDSFIQVVQGIAKYIMLIQINNKNLNPRRTLERLMIIIEEIYG